MKFLNIASFVALLFLLSACGSHPPVPVSEHVPTPTETPMQAPGAVAAGDGPFYTVKKGDTLFSIALDQGHDYKDIAAWNNLENPDLIKIGQPLRMSPPAGETTAVAVVTPVTAPGAVEIKPVAAGAQGAQGASGAVAANTDTLKREPKGGKVPFSEAALVAARATTTSADARPATVASPAAVAPVVAPAVAPAASPATPKPAGAIDWSWPVNGKLISPFVEGSNKGIDLAGKTGDPVYATAAGKVVYAGSGLRGYGMLVIVRHTADFLSAYAHNSQILVKEGQAVTRRQVIAEVGKTDAESPRLHFEIRRQGKPVDPLKLLPVR